MENFIESIIDTNIEPTIIDDFCNTILSNIFEKTPNEKSRTEEDKYKYVFNADYKYIIMQESHCLLDFAINKFGWTDVIHTDCSIFHIKNDYSSFSQKMKDTVTSCTNLNDTHYRSKYIIFKTISTNGCWLYTTIGVKDRNFTRLNELIVNLEEIKVQAEAIKQESIANLATTTSELTNKIADASAKLSQDLTIVDAKIDTKCTDLANQIEHCDESVKELKKNISTLDANMVTNLNTVAQTSLAAINALTEVVNTKLDALKQDFSGKLTVAGTDVDTKVSALSTNVSEQLVQVTANTQEKLDALSVLVKEQIDNTLSNVATEIASVNAKIETIKARFDLVDDLGDKIDEITAFLYPNGKDIVRH